MTTANELFQAAMRAQEAGRIGSAIQLYRHAERNATSPAIAVQCSRLRATCLRFIGEWPEALRLLLATQVRYRLGGRERALTEYDIGVLCLERGGLRTAHLVLSRAARRLRAHCKESASQQNDLAELGLCMVRLSQVNRACGNNTGAELALQEAYELTKSAPNHLAFALLVGAEQCYQQEPDRAIEALGRAGAIVNGRHAYLAAKIDALLAHCYLLESRRDLAWQAYQSCLAFLEPTDEVIQERARTHWGLSELGSMLGIS